MIRATVSDAALASPAQHQAGRYFRGYFWSSSWIICRTVEAGRKADLALYCLDSIPFTPLNNALRQLVYAESGANLDTVIVDGEIVLRARLLTRIDEAAILAEIAAEHTRLRPLIEETELKAAPINEAYRRIYARC